MANAGSSDELICSFCTKSHSQVTKLIVGPGVYICNYCVDLCADIIAEEMGTGRD